jgi:transposase-like protein
VGRAGECSVCQRDDAAEIDSVLAGGGQYKATARKFSIPLSTLRLHWLRCRKGGKGRQSPQKAAPAAEPPPVLPDVPLPASSPYRGLYEQLRAAHADLTTAYARAVEAADDRLIPQLMKELRNNLTEHAALIKVAYVPEITEEDRVLGSEFFRSFERRRAAVLCPACVEATIRLLMEIADGG